MRSTLRSLTFCLSATFAGAAFTQNFYWSVEGSISGCYPGQTVEITVTADGVVMFQATEAVDPGTCTFGGFYPVFATYAELTVTTQCNGMVLSLGDSAAFNFFQDTAFTSVTFECGGVSNDECTNATWITPDTVCTGTLGNLSAATQSMDPIECEGYISGIANDVWYTFIAVGTTSTVQVTGDGDLDVVLEVFADGCGAPGYLDCSDGTFAGGSEEVVLTTTPGTQYHYRVYYFTPVPSVFTFYTCVVNSTVQDCEGVPGGPAVPGTPCDDGNPLTWGDLWSPTCVCVGQDSSQTEDCLDIPGGPNLPGTWCINFFGDTGVWSVDCICVIDTNPLDCLGDPGGTALPGTFCDDNDNNPNTQGVWNSACICTPDTNSFFYDCLGVLNGLSGPGTLCTYTEDSVTYFSGVFNWACVCVNDSNNFYDCSGDLGGTAFIDGCGVCAGGNTGITPNTICADCLGILNGPDVAGTDCTVPGTTLEGTWSADCVCEPNNTEPCNADFWVVQATGSDSLPVPYELWVWNLSSGGSGTFTFNWNFGDGSSSTDAFPTHTYDGNGPYLLCLTITDNNNCTDTHCDTVSINGDGMYEGMVVHHEDRSDGFTINVQNPNANSVEELVGGSIATWPNPAVDELNVAIVSDLKGLVTVTITDLDGRTVKTERTSLSGGRSQLRIATSGLNAGMYLLRISDGNVNLSQRFVKTN